MTATSDIIKANSNPLDGRELNPSETGYFLSGAGVMSCCIGGRVELVGKKGKKKIADAYDRCLATTPILRCIIEGNGEDEAARFRSVEPNDEHWPQIELLPMQKTPAEAFALAKKRKDEYVKNFKEGGVDARRVPLRFCVVCAPPRFMTLSIVALHHFVDGISIGTILLKWFTYFKLPRAVWSWVDRLSTNDLPTFNEMVFKSDLERVQSVVPPSDPPPPFLVFEDHDGSPDHLNGIDENISTVSRRVLRKCLKQLRKDGSTLTSALAALSVKTLAVIMSQRKLIKEGDILLCVTPIDGRRLGKWGDKRDKQKKLLPVVGNYSFPFVVMLDAEDVLKDSIPATAETIKGSIRGVLRDPIQRRSHLLAHEHQPAPHPGICLCGISSINLPSGRSGERVTHLDTDSQHGGLPRSWLMCVTGGKVTSLRADVMLPIENLTGDEVASAIRKAAKGSPLELLVPEDQQAA